MNISIEDITTADIEKVAEVYRTVFTHEGEEWSQESAVRNIIQHLSEGTAWKALAEGEVVGFCLALPLTRELGNELYIDSIGVLSKYQNKGIGASFLQKAEEYVVQNNFAGIRLTGNPKWNSFRWYEKNNFKETGWVDLFKKIN